MLAFHTGTDRFRRGDRAISKKAGAPEFSVSGSFLMHSQMTGALPVETIPMAQQFHWVLLRRLVHW
jgi:hypothetical protein